MCIRTNQEKLKVAKKDITVYKLIDVNPGVFGLNYDLSRCMLFEQPEKYHYTSFYQFALIDCNCVENKQPFIAKGYARSAECLLGARYKYFYGEGLIHTFENEDDAMKSMEPNDFDAFAILYKCTIPKGTEYIKGVEDDDFPSYASKKIIFEEPVHFGEVAKKWHEIKQNMKTFDNVIVKGSTKFKNLSELPDEVREKIYSLRDSFDMETPFDEYIERFDNIVVENCMYHSDTLYAQNIVKEYKLAIAEHRELSAMALPMVVIKNGIVIKNRFGVTEIPKTKNK